MPENLAKKMRRFRWRVSQLPLYAHNLVVNMYWWVRHRTTDKYHVLETGLPPGYYDPDTRIINAVFLQAKKFMEHTEAAVDWNADSDHADAWAKMEAAVTWWDNNPDKHVFFGTEDPKEELQMHLNNLISVLHHMWYT